MSTAHYLVLSFFLASRQVCPHYLNGDLQIVRVNTALQPIQYMTDLDDSRVLEPVTFPDIAKTSVRRRILVSPQQLTCQVSGKMRHVSVPVPRLYIKFQSAIRYDVLRSQPA